MSPAEDEGRERLAGGVHRATSCADAEPQPLTSEVEAMTMAQQTQEMSYAQALNEAKGVIIQQSARIKGDLEKCKSQQQTIVEQAARITEADSKISELSSDFARQAEELKRLEARYAESEAGRQQAEGVVNRQGERINHLEAQVEQFGKDLETANSTIAELTRERDDLRAQLPTTEDIEALNGMMALLSQKRSGGNAGNAGNASAEAQPTMRMAQAA
jgi:chromosome segregation ATPase